MSETREINFYYNALDLSQLNPPASETYYGNPKSPTITAGEMVTLKLNFVTVEREGYQVSNLLAGAENLVISGVIAEDITGTSIIARVEGEAIHLDREKGVISITVDTYLESIYNYIKGKTSQSLLFAAAVRFENMRIKIEPRLPILLVPDTDWQMILPPEPAPGEAWLRDLPAAAEAGDYVRRIANGVRSWVKAVIDASEQITEAVTGHNVDAHAHSNTFNTKLDSGHATDPNAHSALLDTRIAKSTKGAINGVCDLDASGKVPVSRIPAGLGEAKKLLYIGSEVGIIDDTYLANGYNAFSIGIDSPVFQFTRDCTVYFYNSQNPFVGFKVKINGKLYRVRDVGIFTKCGDYEGMVSPKQAGYEPGLFRQAIDAMNFFELLEFDEGSYLRAGTLSTNLFEMRIPRQFKEALGVIEVYVLAVNDLDFSVSIVDEMPTDPHPMKANETYRVIVYPDASGTLKTLITPLGGQPEKEAVGMNQMIYIQEATPKEYSIKMLDMRENKAESITENDCIYLFVENLDRKHNSSAQGYDPWLRFYAIIDPALSSITTEDYIGPYDMHVIAASVDRSNIHSFDCTLHMYCMLNPGAVCRVSAFLIERSKMIAPSS